MTVVPDAEHDHGPGHGQSHGHGHDHGHDHDHSFETDPVPDEAEDMEGIEQITLRSAGLDVGSSTSHLTLSRLVLRRRGAALSSRLEVVERVELYRSDVRLTPYCEDTLIDADELERFFDAAYAEAGVTADQVDTGVVIVTGEAANRPNAEALATRFAARSGGFICVSAGPHYEALLAAHGSGATEMSRAVTGPVLNVDIGGGTTKLSVVEAGEVTATGALSVGARLVAFDADGLVTRIEPPGGWMLKEVGRPVGLGDELDDDTRDRLAGLMVELLLEALGRAPRSPLLERLWVTEPLPEALLADIRRLVFSGGVSEYVYGRETRDFGDLGGRLGELVRARLAGPDGAAGPDMAETSKGIRATVLGAGQHSVQASGVTSFLDDSVLPASALKVVAATVPDPAAAATLAATLTTVADRFRIDGELPDVVFALTVDAAVDHRLLRTLGEQLLVAAPPGEPLFVVLDADVALALGRILRAELGWTAPLVVVDSLEVGDLDYLDIGRPLGPGLTVPVTVKSLTFLTR